MQGRDLDVVDAVRRREVVPGVPASARRYHHGGDRRARVVVDQPRLVLRHVVRRRERLHVERRLRRIRHVDVHEGHERFDLDAVLWKRFARREILHGKGGGRQRGTRARLTDGFVPRHVEHVSAAVRVILPDREVLQAIRGALVRGAGERARHVEVFGRGVAGVPVQLHVPARVLVVIGDVLVTRDQPCIRTKSVTLTRWATGILIVGRQPSWRRQEPTQGLPYCEN